MLPIERHHQGPHARPVCHLNTSKCFAVGRVPALITIHHELVMGLHLGPVCPELTEPICMDCLALGHTGLSRLWVEEGPGLTARHVFPVLLSSIQGEQTAWNASLQGAGEPAASEACPLTGP